MERRLILFTSLPRVGGHSTLTFGLCRMLRPHFDSIEVWCKTMPEHGHSPAIADRIEALGCRVVLLSDERGRLRWPAVAAAVARARKNRPAVFFTLAMRHLSIVLAALVGAGNSVYYHITHDLNPATIRRLNFTARFFRRMVFICPATYEDFPGAADDPRFTWVPQSSEIPVGHPEHLPGEREAECEEDPPARFGLIGRLTEDKGSGEIIRFIDESAARCEIHVAGAGPFADAFRERADRKTGVTVRFFGAYDPSEREAFLRRFFAGIDLLLVPSQDAWETLSMATLEALQHGVPALLCRTGGLVSFGNSQLGPAPDDVVGLVDRAAFAKAMEEFSGRPRRAQDEVVTACRTYYERFFSDEVVRQRWLAVLGTGSPSPLSHRKGAPGSPVDG